LKYSPYFVAVVVNREGCMIENDHSKWNFVSLGKIVLGKGSLQQFSWMLLIILLTPIHKLGNIYDYKVNVDW
jgi:hypothetical protein